MANNNCLKHNNKYGFNPTLKKELSGKIPLKS